MAEGAVSVLAETFFRPWVRGRFTVLRYVSIEGEGPEWASQSLQLQQALRLPTLHCHIADGVAAQAGKAVFDRMKEASLTGAIFTYHWLQCLKRQGNCQRLLSQHFVEGFELRSRWTPKANGHLYNLKFRC